MKAQEDFIFEVVPPSSVLLFFIFLTMPEFCLNNLVFQNSDGAKRETFEQSE